MNTLLITLLAAAVALITPTETMVLLVAGFLASFIQSAFKRYVNTEEGGYGWFKGAVAHIGTLAIAVLIALGVLAYQGELTSWADVVKSMGVIVMASTSTYQLLINKLNLTRKLENKLPVP